MKQSVAQPTNHQLDFRLKAGCPPASQEELCNMEVRRIGAVSDPGWRIIIQGFAMFME